jgi:predicted GNAT family N-acyltransferase
MKLPMLKAPLPIPRVIVAANAEHLNMVAFIRGATFGAEQNCPYFEEFDGNDHCAMHLIGMVDDEPAATIRVRFFAGFAKLERLAVLQRFRQSGISTALMREAISICRRKGYLKLYGQSQERLVGFYAKHGFQPMRKNATVVFSDHAYVEIEADIPPYDEPITIQSDPYLIIRPEGRWDELGVLDRSAARPATNPI